MAEPREPAWSSAGTVVMSLVDIANSPNTQHSMNGRSSQYHVLMTDGHAACDRRMILVDSVPLEYPVHTPTRGDRALYCRRPACARRIAKTVAREVAAAQHARLAEAQQAWRRRIGQFLDDDFDDEDTP